MQTIAIFFHGRDTKFYQDYCIWGNRYSTEMEEHTYVLQSDFQCQEPKIQQTKMLVTCQRFVDLFLFGLVWQYSSVQTKYNKGTFKVMATYLQQ